MQCTSRIEALAHDFVAISTWRSFIVTTTIYSLQNVTNTQESWLTREQRYFPEGEHIN
jgi:hypothetical protein